MGTFNPHSAYEGVQVIGCARSYRASKQLDQDWNRESELQTSVLVNLQFSLGTVGAIGDTTENSMAVPRKLKMELP